MVLFQTMLNRRTSTDVNSSDMDSTPQPVSLQRLWAFSASPPSSSPQVAQTLAAHALKPSDLTIEITESLMLDQTASVTSNTDTLSEMGVNLSMDDFGTGYSSLSLIARLPVSELKIDRAFIDKLESDAGAQAVTTAVICIGQSLDMRVVAEGVETDAQRRFLDALGCDAHQGYLYSKPLSADAMDAWLDANAGKPAPLQRRA